MNSNKKIGLASIMLAALALSGSALADPIGGSIHDGGALLPGITVRYTAVLDGSLTAFEVEGDGDGDIDCEIRDRNGRLLAYDRTGEDGCDLMVRAKGTVYFFAFNAGDEVTWYDAKIY